MHKTVVINAVGLTRSLLGDQTPRLRDFASRGRAIPIGHVLPAVTCSVQGTYLTGAWPNEHGIVGNGWYFRDQCEIRFWHQSNKLVQRPKVWELAHRFDPDFTCANLFWWFNMYSSTDFAVTPRPMYPADGRKVPDIYTHPADLREQLQAELGQFPLFNFWGPGASIRASEWIAESAIRVDRKYSPTLTLIYLPHLDYPLQKLGPASPRIVGELGQLDAVCGRLIDHYSGSAARIIILSEYGIEPATRPVCLNRILRQRGLLAVREELGRELLDAGGSIAFAVADHQVAHVYVNDPAKISEVAMIIRGTPGVAEVYDQASKPGVHLDHDRAGDLVALAEPGAWFTYYYWLDDALAPDFARTVEIHRKPGYDPAELFIDPRLAAPKLKIAWTLLKRKLGFRSLLEVIPLDATLVQGSHGRPPSRAENGPILISSEPGLVPAESLEPTAVCGVMLDHLTKNGGG